MTPSVRGRLYDLVWYLQNKVVPNAGNWHMMGISLIQSNKRGSYLMLKWLNCEKRSCGWI
jgi:hypothetical protein